MKKVLIAHQSTIPHYRVPFYNALEQLKPNNWEFDVVFDSSDLEKKRFFREGLDPTTFSFSTLDTNTLSLQCGSKKLNYQTFWRNASQYDLIIVENAINNLTYPLCHFHKLSGRQFAYWGHGKHTVNNPSALKYLSEYIKLQLVRNADGFFAYSSGVKKYLIKQGISPEKIFVLNNTIDINTQRIFFNKLHDKRDKIRKNLNVHRKKVLIFVGRFRRDRRIHLLLEAFSIIQNLQPEFHLFLVGSDGELFLQSKQEQITYFGPITDLDKLAPLYVASDVFAIPDAVGLGPLQALCYDLPIVTIDSSIHGPEIEYLTSDNAIILPRTTSANEYADQLIQLFSIEDKLQTLRTKTWSSISHLTIEQMANNFILGVNTILEI